MQLKTREITVDSRWSVDTKEKLFTAEASSLGYRAGEVPGEQLYDDAADWGIALHNASSGNTTRWYLLSTISSQDHWTYLPTCETVQKFPSLAGWRVRIYND